MNNEKLQALARDLNRDAPRSPYAALDAGFRRKCRMRRACARNLVLPRKYLRPRHRRVVAGSATGQLRPFVYPLRRFLAFQLHPPLQVHHLARERPGDPILPRRWQHPGSSAHGVIKIVRNGKAGLNSGEAAEFRYLLSQSESASAEEGDDEVPF